MLPGRTGEDDARLIGGDVAALGQQRRLLFNPLLARLGKVRRGLCLGTLAGLIGTVLGGAVRQCDELAQVE